MGIKDNLSHWWDNPDDLTDQHASWTLTENGTLTTTSGGGPNSQDVGNANATNDYAGDTVAPLSYYTSLSLAGWVRINTLTSNASVVSQSDGSGGDQYLWAFFRNADSKKLTFRLYDGAGSFVDIAALAAPSTATWYWWAWTCDGSDVELFMDNVSQGTASITGLGAKDTGTAPFRLYQRSWSNVASTQLLGDMMSVAIAENHVWTADERSTMWNSGNGILYDELPSGTSFHHLRQMGA